MAKLSPKETHNEQQMRQAAVFERPEGAGQGSDDTVTVRPQQPGDGRSEQARGLEPEVSRHWQANQVSQSLQALADAMLKERIAKLSYKGTNWDQDGQGYTNSSMLARSTFEQSLNQFVEYLSHG